MSIDLNKLDNKLKEAKTYYSNGKLRTHHVMNYDGSIVFSEAYSSTGKLIGSNRLEKLTPESFWYFRTDNPKEYIIKNYKSLGYNLREVGDDFFTDGTDISNTRYIIKLFPNKITTNIFENGELRRVISENEKEMRVKDNVGTEIFCDDVGTYYFHLKSYPLVRWTVERDLLINFSSYYLAKEEPAFSFKLHDDRVEILIRKRRKINMYHRDGLVSELVEIEDDKLIHKIRFGDKPGKPPVFSELNNLIIFYIELSFTFGNVIEDKKEKGSLVSMTKKVRPLEI